MRKVIASINMTLDGFCDHTAGITDVELHDHYTEVLNTAGTLLYGRTTYQLMESYWPLLLKEPSGDRSMDEFASAIDKVPKVVFSHTMDHLEWESARLARKELKEEVLVLKQEPGNDIFVGSPGLISQLTDLQLIDEYQLCVHPVIIDKGLPLFRNTTERIVLKLLKTKTFGSGAILLYYEPNRA